MKIRRKISLIFLVQFFIFLVIVGGNIYFVANKLITERTFSHLETTAGGTASHIETYLNQNIERLKLVTSRTKLKETVANYVETPTAEDQKTITSIIVDAMEPISDFERINILDLSGNVIASTEDFYINKNYSNTDYFIKGKQKESVFFVSDESDIKIYASGPFVYNGKVVAVGVTVIDMSVLNSILEERTGLGETGETLIAIKDEDGQPLFLNNRLFPYDFLATAKGLAEPMKAALDGKEGHYSNNLDYRGVEVFAVIKYIDFVNLGLVSKIDKTEALASLYYVLIYFGIASLSLLILYYFVTYFFSRKISLPIEKLRQGVEIITKGDLDYKVALEANDEIGDLSHAFDDMTGAIKKSRAEVDLKVKEQTKEIIEKAQDLADQQKAVLNILEDVEVEKDKAESFANDLEKFKLAVENASDHIVITDVEGNIIYANKAVERITGFSNKEILGQKAGNDSNWGGHMKNNFYKKLWSAIKKDKKVFAGEIENTRKDGEKYTALASISPVIDKNGEVIFFVGIERDITKEKEIDKAKTEFVSLASHQLRTPLSSINWYTEMLLAGDAGKLNKEQKEYLEEVYRGNQRMVALVNSLLNVSRLELGTFMVEPEEIRLINIIKDLLKELAPKIDEKKLKIKDNFDKKVDKYTGDPKLLGIVVQNLLSNAVKYTPKKGSITVTLKKYKDDILFEVKDTGLGIPRNQHSKIFTKLFRADNVKETDTEGTGLGLYMVKSIVEYTGGKIWFKSQIKKGTTFSVVLPAKGMAKKKGTRQLDLNTEKSN